jgi:phage protein D
VAKEPRTIEIGGAAQEMINIKIVGEDFEGEYMANTVTHCFDRKSGYITEFALKRNMCG